MTGKIPIPDTRTHGPVFHHLCVKHVRISQAAELDRSFKLPREHKSIWTERIPAERRAFKLSHVLYLLEAGLLEGCTHFLSTGGKMGTRG